MVDLSIVFVNVCWATYILIGGLEHVLFSHILGIITPTVGGLEHVFFPIQLGMSSSQLTFTP